MDIEIVVEHHIETVDLEGLESFEFVKFEDGFCGQEALDDDVVELRTDKFLKDVVIVVDDEYVVGCGFDSESLVVEVVGTSSCSSVSTTKEKHSR